MRNRVPVALLDQNTTALYELFELGVQFTLLVPTNSSGGKRGGVEGGLFPNLSVSLYDVTKLCCNVYTEQNCRIHN